jgi:septal ring factor EnvC (AmiA/AmiB activator)
MCRKPFAAFCLLLALSSSVPLLAQEGATSSPAMPPSASVPTSLPDLIQTSQLLKARLETRKAQAQAQVESWQSIAEALRKEIALEKQNSAESLAKLAKAEAELSKSQADLKEISKSLDALSTDFDGYKQKSEAKIQALTIENGLYKKAGTALLVLAAGLGAYLGGHALGAW